MVINIYTGKHFSQLNLFLKTNKFFNKRTFGNLLTNREANYIISIGKKYVKVVMSSRCDKNDFDKIKEYIETIFENQSILVKATGTLTWLDDVKNVKIMIF